MDATRLPVIDVSTSTCQPHSDFILSLNLLHMQIQRFIFTIAGDDFIKNFSKIASMPKKSSCSNRGHDLRRYLLCLKKLIEANYKKVISGTKRIW
jgi:hypothetical protein